MIVIPTKAEIPLLPWEDSGTPAPAGVTVKAVTCFSAAVAEVDRRRVLRGCGGFERHLRLRAVEDLRADRAREGPDQGIIFAHRLVIVAPRDFDAVFGALELILEGHEVLVGL